MTLSQTYLIDCHSLPKPPYDLRKDLRPLNHVPRGVVRIRSEQLTVHRCKAQLNGSRFTTGENMLRSCIGLPAITAHVHDFFMRHPGLVPPEMRGYIVHSMGSLFEGYKGTLFCRCFYFVDGNIHEDCTLVQGEVKETLWESYQVVGLMPGMPALRKAW